ncbi:MAG: response regulator [Nitrospirae bacterium]|nr:response regulator [Nitrospirota bacterium]
MTENILFVDDEPHVLEGFQRQLRKDFCLEVALGGERGLEAVATRGPFAVIVADMRMPGMDGTQFLSRVREQAPESVRMMLTGNADQQTAIDAINQGQIFRFMTKPCAPEVLVAALRAGLEQHRLITAEKVLLEQTPGGCIKVLCDVLALVNPEAFGRSSRITRYVEAIASQMGLGNTWVLTTAAMLSQVGCVILPEGPLKKIYRGESLTPEEKQLYKQHPYLASDLLVHIPRMQEVAAIIACQDVYVDEHGVPRDSSRKEAVPLGSRILKVALDFDAIESGGVSKTVAFHRLQENKFYYDPAVLDALKRALADEIKYEVKAVPLSELSPQMILAEDILSASHALLVAKGQEVSQSLIGRLQTLLSFGIVKQPFLVLIPLAGGARTAGHADAA